MTDTSALIIAAPQALDDGDVITPELLNRLEQDPPRDPGPRLAAALLAPALPPADLARPSRADAALRAEARAWLLANADRLEPGAPGETALLHAFETAALTRPAARERARAVDGELGELYLMLCRHWIATTEATGDPRFLNAALKILAVCLLTDQATTRLARAALRAALSALANLTVPHAPHTPAAPTTGGRARLEHPARIAVLAGASSRGLRLFRSAAHAADLPITGVLLYEPADTRSAADSSYAEAWYPAPRADARSAAPPMTVPGHTPPTAPIAHRDWEAAAGQLRRWQIDLLVLLGMDIVPPNVLDAASLGAINAHNGALPSYRGMDAVGWTLLAHDPPTCTVHLAVPDVDAGDILAERTVPASSPDLRRDMKDAQIALLVQVCRTLASTGALPAGRPQTGAARRHYRMHPAIRRVLDARTRPAGDGPEGARP